MIVRNLTDLENTERDFADLVGSVGSEDQS